MANDLPHRSSGFHGPAEWVLLGVGCFLILFPVGVAIESPTVLISAQLFLRVIAALGGSLVGGLLPGALQIVLPGIRAAGALGVFVLIYMVNPPVVAANVSNPLNPETITKSVSSPTQEQLQNWIIKGNNGSPQIDTTHSKALTNWMNTNGFKNLPLATLLAGKGPDLERGRKAAITDLEIPK